MLINLRGFALVELVKAPENKIGNWGVMYTDGNGLSECLCQSDENLGEEKYGYSVIPPANERFVDDDIVMETKAGDKITLFGGAIENDTLPTPEEMFMRAVMDAMEPGYPRIMQEDFEDVDFDLLTPEE